MTVKMRDDGNPYMVKEMQDIEEFFYESVTSKWTNFSELSFLLTTEGSHLTLNGMGIDGFTATDLVNYFFGEYYRKIWLHYDEPDFREKHLNVLERTFPDRTEFQIAVVKDPRDENQWRVRKMLFRRFQDRYRNIR